MLPLGLENNIHLFQSLDIVDKYVDDANLSLQLFQVQYELHHSRIKSLKNFVRKFSCLHLIWLYQ
jgi:hypothetical protein